jgi:hypothetical protein
MSKRPTEPLLSPCPKRTKEGPLTSEERDAPIPSITTLFAERDAQKRERKAKHDHATLRFVRGCIKYHTNMQLIEAGEDGKRGYQVSFGDGFCPDRVPLGWDDYADIVPALRAEVGEDEVVTACHRDGVTIITFMEA